MQLGPEPQAKNDLELDAYIIELSRREQSYVGITLIWTLKTWIYVIHYKWIVNLYKLILCFSSFLVFKIFKGTLFEVHSVQKNFYKLLLCYQMLAICMLFYLK